MKKLLYILSFSLLLISCGKNEPDNKIHNTEVIEKGYISQGPGAAPLRVFDTLYYVEPTWGQANHFAKGRGDYEVWQIAGWILILLIAVLIHQIIIEASWLQNINSRFLGAALFVLIAGSVTCLKWQSASIKWNNKKEISKQLYERAIKETGSIRVFWDSLEKDCLIVYGPYNCYK